jgi:hypothetical protein
VTLSLRSIVLGMIIVGVVFFDWGSRNVGSVINNYDNRYYDTLDSHIVKCPGAYVAYYCDDLYHTAWSVIP